MKITENNIGNTYASTTATSQFQHYPTTASDHSEFYIQNTTKHCKHVTADANCAALGDAWPPSSTPKFDEFDSHSGFYTFAIYLLSLRHIWSFCMF